MTVREVQTALGTAPILKLVRLALNDFETIALSGSIRRAIRIANLIGDPQTAVRLSLEIRSHGGNRFRQSASLVQYLTDSKNIADADGPAGRALEEYIKDRSPDRADMVWCHTISELEELASRSNLDDEIPAAILEWRHIARSIVERAGNQTFALLCRWERELTYTETNEEIYAGNSLRAEGLVREDTLRELNMQSAGSSSNGTEIERKE